MMILTFMALMEGASCSATETVKEFEPTIVFPLDAERLISACAPAFADKGTTTDISISVKAPISAVSAGDTVTFHSAFVQVADIDNTVPTCGCKKILIGGFSLVKKINY